MAFEKFTEPRSRGYEPMASIWSRGMIGLNQGAVNEFELEKYDYVVLYFDRETRRIGIKFTRDGKEEGAIKLSKRESGASISARSFMKKFKIKIGNTAKCDISYDDDNALHVIELPESVKVG
jgi:hypothetical protein